MWTRSGLKSLPLIDISYELNSKLYKCQTFFMYYCVKKFELSDLPFGHNSSTVCSPAWGIINNGSTESQTADLLGMTRWIALCTTTSLMWSKPLGSYGDNGAKIQYIYATEILAIVYIVGIREPRNESENVYNSRKHPAIAFKSNRSSFKLKESYYEITRKEPRRCRDDTRRHELSHRT